MSCLSCCFLRFADTLEQADDMAIDIPHIWLYLAELLSPVLREGGFSMRELFRYKESYAWVGHLILKEAYNNNKNSHLVGELVEIFPLFCLLPQYASLIHIFARWTVTRLLSSETHVPPALISKINVWLCLESFLRVTTHLCPHRKLS